MPRPYTKNKRYTPQEIHVYTAGRQPAHDFTDRCGDRPLRITYSKRKKLRAHCCGKLRHAGNLWVQVYYDSIHRWCKDGCGCKK
jgi:hypothetical protein